MKKIFLIFSLLSITLFAAKSPSYGELTQEDKEYSNAILNQMQTLLYWLKKEK